MTVKEIVSILSRFPENTHLLLDVNGQYTSLLSSDFHIVHKSKLNIELQKEISDIINTDFEYIGSIKRLTTK